MKNSAEDYHFESLNAGYRSVFKIGRLSIGLVVPMEQYTDSAVPTMEKHLEKAKLAEQLGFSSLWLRDVPFNVPEFGDAGQIFDPFVYLGYLAAHTHKIALGVSSIILPLRHPAHVAKAAASADLLSNGRLILGVASGDRPQEYPAMNLDYYDRGARFRESFEYIRQMQLTNPSFTGHYGQFNGNIDMLPKPKSGRLPLLITGASQQSTEWIAKNGDGWMIYPRDINIQKEIIQTWKKQITQAGRYPQPIMQPLYFDLIKSEQPQPLHLGFRSNTSYLIKYLKQLEAIGVNHVALNLRFNQLNIEETLTQLSNEVLAEFAK